MGYVVLIRDNDGVPSYVNKIFTTEEEAYTFVKTHSSSIHDFEIVTQEEFSTYLQSQQQARPDSYYQTTMVDDGIQSHRPIISNFRPATFKPVFLGRKQRG